MNPSSLPGLAGLTGEPIARRSLDPAHCVLVVIDIQEKLLAAISNREELLANARLLIRAAQILKLPALMAAGLGMGLRWRATSTVWSLRRMGLLFLPDGNCTACRNAY